MHRFGTDVQASACLGHRITQLLSSGVCDKNEPERGELPEIFLRKRFWGNLRDGSHEIEELVHRLPLLVSFVSVIEGLSPHMDAQT